MLSTEDRISSKFLGVAGVGGVLGPPPLLEVLPASWYAGGDSNVSEVVSSVSAADSGADSGSNLRVAVEVAGADSEA